MALKLLEKEFPNLKAYELPSYNITYPEKANNFKIKLLKDSPHFIKTIKREKKVIETLVEDLDISGIISDNRFGVRHKTITSVFITHQLRVLSGSTTWLSSKLHLSIISKFDECWVPDYAGAKNLGGDLSHVEDFTASVKYIGPLTRLSKLELETKYDLLVLLSGPEPQRTILEKKLLKDLKNYQGKVLFIKGKVEAEQHKDFIDNIVLYNFMTSHELEIAINESALILNRSGYTTIMDLAKLEKNAFFIPTPGQFEQDYLAKKLDAEGIAPYSNQGEFNINMLSEIKNYSGFKCQEHTLNYTELFGLF